MAVFDPMDTVYRLGYAITIILDIRITGMTGLQEHPEQDTLKGED
jgi:TPP-dependent indolepyruvate ferredoxin oxidoreductase alpha subunit